MAHDTAKMKRTIVRLICMAQAASDAGKHIYDLSWFDGLKIAEKLGYAGKDKYIVEAINLCKRCPDCGIRYSYSKQPDQHGNPSVLIYFRIKREGNTALQVSFHTFNRQLKATAGASGQGMKTHWASKQLGSRAACEILIKEFSL